MRRPLLLAFVSVHALLIASCSRTVHLPDLGRLYDAAAQRHEPWRNPVIVIPGILGSRLRDRETKRLVWGASSGDYADPRTAEGARLVALPMRPGVPLSELRDAVYADGALDRLRVNVLGLPVTLNAYVNILALLGVGGYRDATLGSDREDLVRAKRRIDGAWPAVHIDHVVERPRCPVPEAVLESREPPRVDVRPALGEAAPDAERIQPEGLDLEPRLEPVHEDDPSGGGRGRSEKDRVVAPGANPVDGPGGKATQAVCLQPLRAAMRN